MGTAAVVQQAPAATAAVQQPATASTSTAVQQPSMEDKILVAASQAETIVGIFSPAAAEMVQAGVSVEPLMSGMIRLIVGLFHHHTGVAPSK